MSAHCDVFMSSLTPSQKTLTLPSFFSTAVWLFDTSIYAIPDISPYVLDHDGALLPTHISLSESLSTVNTCLSVTTCCIILYIDNVTSPVSFSIPSPYTLPALSIAHTEKPSASIYLISFHESTSGIIVMPEYDDTFSLLPACKISPEAVTA